MQDVQRVNWEYLIQEENTKKLQQHIESLGMSESGKLIHNWLKNTFQDDLHLNWEETVEYGRYDAADDFCIYEFKTKHPNVFDTGPPYNRDVDQVRKYLESDDVEADFGILVYLNRGQLDQVQEYLVNGSVTKLD